MLQRPVRRMNATPPSQPIPPGPPVGSGNELRRGRWFPAALLAGVLYLVIGRAFAAPASHALAWRRAAWLVSGAVFLAHILYEHFRLRHSPGTTARHTALAVAIGAFALAAAGMMRDVASGSPFRASWLLALVLWPVFTALPAFMVAAVAAPLLTN